MSIKKCEKPKNYNCEKNKQIIIVKKKNWKCMICLQLRSEGREHAALATAASDHAPSSAQPSLHAERVLSPPGRGGDGSRRGGEEEERATDRERERGKADSDAIRELKLELK